MAVRTLIPVEAFLLVASLLVLAMAELECILVEDIVFVHAGECQDGKLRVLDNTESLVADKIIRIHNNNCCYTIEQNEGL